MKKLFTATLIIIGLFVSFAAGGYATVHSILGVDKSEAGFQVYFADSTY